MRTLLRSTIIAVVGLLVASAHAAAQARASTRAVPGNREAIPERVASAPVVAKPLSGKPVKLRVVEHAVVRGASVLVRDIATVDAGGDPNVQRAVEAIEVARRPNFGYNRALQHRDIINQLAHAGVMPTDLEITGAREVLLQPRVHVVQPEEVEKIAKQELEGYLQKTTSDEVDVSTPERLRPMHVPPGRVSFDLKPRIDHTKPPTVDRASVFIDILVDGEVWRSERVDFRISRHFKALYVTRPVDRGEALGPHNTEMRRCTVGRGVSLEVRGYDQLRSRVASRRLSANRFLMTTDLAEPAVVRPGDRVRVIAKSRGIRVTLLGVAQGRAARGERLQVLAQGQALDTVALAPGIVTVTPY